jgi:translocation and assembly module TamA
VGGGVDLGLLLHLGARVAAAAQRQEQRGAPGVEPGLGEDVAGTASWAHRNWLGGLRKLQLDATLGWAFIRNVWRPDFHGPVALLSADFTQPDAVARRVDLNLRAEAEHRVEEGYRYFAERLRAGTPARLGPVTAVPSINLEYYQTFGDATRNELGGQAQALLNCPGDQRTCLLAYLEQRLELDFRDDAVETRRGLYLSVSLQEGVRAFGQGFSYLRVLPEARAFLPLGRSVLAFRGRFGLLHAYGAEGVPLLARFTGGGPGQMRGYGSRRLSPLVPLSRGGYAPVGGTGLIDGSLELRFPIAGPLGGVAFLDGGNTELRASDIWKLDRLQWAAGLGLRYHSLFGPVRVDVGVRLPRSLGEGLPMPRVPLVRLEGTSIVDTGDSKAEPAVAVHLSIGEAF